MTLTAAVIVNYGKTRKIKKGSKENILFYLMLWRNSCSAEAVIVACDEENLWWLVTDAADPFFDTLFRLENWRFPKAVGCVETVVSAVAAVVVDRPLSRDPTLPDFSTEAGLINIWKVENKTVILYIRWKQKTYSWHSDWTCDDGIIQTPTEDIFSVRIAGSQPGSVAWRRRRNTWLVALAIYRTWTIDV